MKLEGIHHITAITGDAVGNVEFYAGVLGLRMIKKTVNQDDPTVYHLFYGDEHGSPGMDLTFFEYPGAAQGRAGPAAPLAAEEARKIIIYNAHIDLVVEEFDKAQEQLTRLVEEVKGYVAKSDTHGAPGSPRSGERMPQPRRSSRRSSLPSSLNVLPPMMRAIVGHVFRMP